RSRAPGVHTHKRPRDSAAGQLGRFFNQCERGDAATSEGSKEPDVEPGPYPPFLDEISSKRRSKGTRFQGSPVPKGFGTVGKDGQAPTRSRVARSPARRQAIGIA